MDRFNFRIQKDSSKNARIFLFLFFFSFFVFSFFAFSSNDIKRDEWQQWQRNTWAVETHRGIYACTRSILNRRDEQRQIDNMSNADNRCLWLKLPFRVARPRSVLGVTRIPFSGIQLLRVLLYFSLTFKDSDSISKL